MENEKINNKSITKLLETVAFSNGVYVLWNLYDGNIHISNLLANGAAPKDVQELLGHSDVSTTMNVYAHSTRKAKRESAKLLDKVAGND